MEKLTFKCKSAPTDGKHFGITSGVVNSGNLEILIEQNSVADEVDFTITTTVKGFAETWQAVVNEFAENYALGGCHLLLNDCGATPAIVALRLRQLYESFSGAVEQSASDNNYLELNARERIAAIVDKNSFTEWLTPIEKISSPHLGQLDLPVSFDDGVIIGSAQFNKKTIYIASQNFAFMGGAVGEVNGAKLTGLCLKALKTKPDAVILLLDSGGVRLQEANAGEIAISEIITAVMQLRVSGIPVLGIVAGKNGAFGGIGIISQCLDNIILTENARTGVSGPEVIETVMGTAEYDSSDRALVWRTCGGRHRAIMGDGIYCGKKLAAIKTELAILMNSYEPLSIEMLQNENKMLAERISQTQNCKDGSDIWAKLGINNAKNIPNLSDEQFLGLMK